PRGAPEEVITGVLGHAPDRVDGIFDAALIADPLLPAVKDDGVFVSASGERVPVAERGVRVDVVEGRPDAARLKELLELVGS
ncbi:NADP-dependent oxidoreductase, partial [Streptomyces hydrogenans]